MKLSLEAQVQRLTVRENNDIREMLQAFRGEGP